MHSAIHIALPLNAYAECVSLCVRVPMRVRVYTWIECVWLCACIVRCVRVCTVAICKSWGVKKSKLVDRVCRYANLSYFQCTLITQEAEKKHSHKTEIFINIPNINWKTNENTKNIRCNRISALSLKNGKFLIGNSMALSATVCVWFIQLTSVDFIFISFHFIFFLGQINFSLTHTRAQT